MSIAQNIRKAVNYSRKNGYGEAFCAAWERVTAKYYADYTYVPPSREVLNVQAADKSLPDIKFSILVPAYETQEVYMRALIDSCIAQSYTNWELIIADGSDADVVEKTVGTYADERIRYIRLENNSGIAGNTNSAIEHAAGDYCALLDHDDMLTADALYEMARAIGNKRPTLVYSDEDKCDSEGQRFYEPHFKLDFNLDMILTNNYICHLLVVDTETLKKLRIRKEYDGSQDFDLILRVVSSLLLKEREGAQGEGVRKMEEAILHVPKVLYHWRCHQNSTADNPQSKMYAYEAGKKALIDFASRMGWKADVRHNKHLGFYRIVYRNDVLMHRPDLAAVGGYVVRRGKIASGIYRGQPIIYAGYMNRMDLYQNVAVLDIRNMAVGKAYYDIYEKVTGHPYESTLVSSDYDRSGGARRELPQWMKELDKTAEGRKRLDKLGAALCRQLLAGGGRLLLDPESVRKL